MPSMQRHCERDREFFGQEFPEVHKILDQFAHYPDMEFLERHRKFLHHREGIEYITMRYGPMAGEAARQHIQDDCEHVPWAVDYYTGRVDEFGYPKPQRMRYA